MLLEVNLHQYERELSHTMTKVCNFVCEELLAKTSYEMRFRITILRPVFSTQFTGPKQKVIFD